VSPTASPPPAPPPDRPVIAASPRPTAAAAPELRPVPRSEQIAVLATILLPLAGIAGAAAMLWGTGFRWSDLALLVVFYLFTGLGITIGFHRLFTHRSFEAPAAVRFVLAVAGSMATQGALMQWVGTHRRHHQHSDEEEDPHSPHGHGRGVWNTFKGFWHAHTGWLLASEQAEMQRYARDLEQDPVARFVHRSFGLWVLAGLVIPGLLGGLLTLSWTGALTGFLWGGLIRVFLVHHATWSVNSACHLWGRKTYRSHDESRNNTLVGILAMGEGWHNNHHAFPRSARHGLAWWQFDLSWLVIRGLELVGLARRVNLPDPDRMAAKRRDTEP